MLIDTLFNSEKMFKSQKGMKFRFVIMFPCLFTKIYLHETTHNGNILVIFLLENDLHKKKVR